MRADKSETKSKHTLNNTYKKLGAYRHAIDFTQNTLKLGGPQ